MGNLMLTRETGEAIIVGGEIKQFRGGTIATIYGGEIKQFYGGRT